MRLIALQIQNFRCFPRLELEFDQPIVLLAGPNGTGKTSLLEAIHYCAHTRSFKTHRTQELIHWSAAEPPSSSVHHGFRLVSSIATPFSCDAITVGVAPGKRSLKLNQQAVSSYKQLREVFDVLTISAEDCDIVAGAPARRRSFFDHLLWRRDETYLPLMRRYRKIVDNRNALLQRQMTADDHYRLWTEQLLSTARTIANKRIELLATLNQQVATLIASHFPHTYHVSLSYNPSLPYTEVNTVQELLREIPDLKEREYRYRRTLFGPHLDEYQFMFDSHVTRSYASRGQQKLVLFLLKLSQAAFLHTEASQNGLIILIDDMLTDFDPETLRTVLSLVQATSSQIILTSPHASGPLAQYTTELITDIGGSPPQKIILK